MSGLVNYSSEEDQDDYHNKKVGERERVQRSGRRPVDMGVNRDGKRQLKKHYRERSKSSSSSNSSSNHSAGGRVVTPPRKEKFVDDGKDKRSKSTNAINNNNNNTSSGSYNDEGKYKGDKRSEKYSRDPPRDKRENRDVNKYSKDNRGGGGGGGGGRDRDRDRDYKDEHNKSHDNSHFHETRRYDDTKRHGKDYNKRDHNNKREGNTEYYNRDDKRFRNDDTKKIHNNTSSSYNKDRFNASSKSRYEERKTYDDRNNERREENRRINDDRRNSGNNSTYGRREGTTDYDDRKDRRNNNDERRAAAQRSYSSQDRTNSYRSNSNKYPERRPEEDRKYHHSSDTAAGKDSETQSNTHRGEYSSSETRSNDLKLSSSSPHEVPEKKILPSARNFEALLTLPLSETALKQPNTVTVPAAIAVSDDTTATSVQLPNYYNPKVINATKYATQMQKRKLIWGSKKTEDVAAKWGHAQFSQDSDGKVASKFMRLMGIKNSGTESNAEESGGGGGDKPQTASSATATVAPNKPDFKTREAMFSTMEQQYEVARQVTHTMRGVGLGFSSQSRPY